MEGSTQLPGQVDEAGSIAKQAPQKGTEAQLVEVEKSPPAEEKEPPSLTKVEPTPAEPLNVVPPNKNGPQVSQLAAPNHQEPEERGPPPGPLKRHWRKIRQQELRPSRAPQLAYGRRAQAACGGCCAVFLILIAALLLSTSVSDIVVPYTEGLTEKEFDVGEALTGPVHVKYELPNVLLNHKTAVAGKDSFVWTPFMMGEYQCDSAETLQDASWRRPEAQFQAMLSGGGSSQLPNLFRPCGLVALAMFTDDFTLERDGATVEMKQTELTLPKDDEIYEKKILPIDGKTASSPLPHYTIDGKNSWLRMGSHFEHFKVWYRTPASTIAHNLWARIPDGLPAGKYKLKFTVNDPVWKTRWGVDEKRIIFSESSTFGNAGACQVLGSFCLFFGICEALVAIGFVVDLLRKPR